MKRPDGTVSPVGIAQARVATRRRYLVGDLSRHTNAISTPCTALGYHPYGEFMVMIIALSLVVMAQLGPAQQPSDVEIARAFQHNDGPHSEISCEGCHDLNDIHNVNVRSACRECHVLSSI